MAGEEKVKKKAKKKSKDPYSWKRSWAAQKKKDVPSIRRISELYMDYLNRAKTEREAVAYWEERLLENGFIDIAGGTRKVPKEGRGFFLVNRGKQIFAGIVGSCDLQEGMNIVLTHLDAPRIDLKPMPIDGDRDTGLGILRTHYYGGIKKYHWVNIPLALHGRVIKRDGSHVDISVGEGDEDPVFLIPDLEPHLSGKVQNKRKLSEGIKGEEMLVLAGSGTIPDEDEERAAIVEDVLRYLHSEYGIEEEDLISSDMTMVPAWKPKEIGLDRGLIGAYGHDNRVSSFCAMQALLDMKRERTVPSRWTLAANFDREEIGSEGNTGARSQSFEMAIYDLLLWTGAKGTRRELMKVMSRSFALSADVKSGMNPMFKSVQDPMNSARIGAGITITKYTGKGGKVGANDASAEMVGSIRRLFNESGINWQMQETGRVDAGGGGTVAKFVAVRNMDVLDVGIPLLSMHSPFEVLSKLDVHTANQAFKSFFCEFTK
jgi:aspartyl aminopeptidase